MARVSLKSHVSGKGFHMTTWQNLAERTSNGCTVSLDYWTNLRGETTIRVSYVSPSADFILYPPNDRALDAFHHPWVYFDRVMKRGTYDDHSDAEKTRYAQNTHGV